MANDAKYFVGTQAECEALVARMDAHFGYPSKNAKTYDIPLQHNADPTKWMVVIDSGIPEKVRTRATKLADVEVMGKLLTEEKSNFKTRLDLKTENAFAETPMAPSPVKEKIVSAPQITGI